MRHIFGFFIAACVAVLLSFPATAQQPTYTLGSGDKVRVTVFGEQDLSGEFEISGDGQISLPLIGNLDAGGKSLRQLKETMESALREGYLKDPKVAIEVMNYRPFYILGEVNEPGSYPYVSGMSVLNAVALGGGFTYRADKEDILIIRGGDESRKPEKATPETVVLPGDIVRVEERFF
ncbi:MULTISPECIES: polysaccharide biosynthesis/export family protein [Thalassospira]|uniref:Polysaccharide biosynthesis protein n=2 Tax=Thalassospira TaxID=168934 RepID=A0A367W1T1_9PROT|nr:MULTISPECIES: polysaccharide biosynthesis/export family protein [Thalassospira]MDG4720109.1 polysaccharide export protein [Thalassospira sp. FZY0004]RCK31770.1 polysaccharide biosynthesis protein [Thalassospira profundimaris]